MEIYLEGIDKNIGWSSYAVTRLSKKNIYVSIGSTNSRIAEPRKIGIIRWTLGGFSDKIEIIGSDELVKRINLCENPDDVMTIVFDTIKSLENGQFVEFLDAYRDYYIALGKSEKRNELINGLNTILNLDLE